MNNSCLSNKRSVVIVAVSPSPAEDLLRKSLQLLLRLRIHPCRQNLLAVGAHAGDSRKQLGVLLHCGDGALEVRGVLEQLHELHGVVRHVRHIRRHLVRLQPTDPRVSKAWRVQTQAVHLR